jgi:hypothetical protein
MQEMLIVQKANYELNFNHMHYPLDNSVWVWNNVLHIATNKAGAFDKKIH